MCYCQIQHSNTRTDLIISGERPYECSSCPSKFSTSGGLKLHSNTHLTDKKFSCTFCSKVFVSELYCRRHTRVAHKNGHVKTMGERKCKFCGKIFASPSACSRHVRIHTGKSYLVIYVNILKTFRLVVNRSSSIQRILNFPPNYSMGLDIKR